VLNTRRLKTANHDEDGDAALEHDLENMDLYSDTTSQYSALTSTAGKGPKTNPMSIQTKASSSRTKSSKNRRKQERKKYSTKEGALHEDIGLIASLHQIISDVYNLHVPEVTSLLRALMRIPGKFEHAQKLQELMNSFLNIISEKEAIIWPDSGKEDVASNEVRI
jgi:elongator complex protein 1